MTKEQIITTNNHTLAVFMELTCTNSWTKLWQTTNKTPLKFSQFIDNLIENESWYITDLNFHNDWNWLMFVVEKIEQIKIESYNININILSNNCSIFPAHWDKMIGVISETKIQAVYEATVEFIKWYNNNK